MLSSSNNHTLPGQRRSLAWIILPAVIIWFLLWYGQWQVYFNPHIWFRLGIGLILFIVPGLCIYGLVVGRRGITFSHVTFGFVLSHLIFALMGTVGRIFHLSFETIKFLMILMGAFLLSGYLLTQFRGAIKFTLRNLDLSRILPIFLLILTSLLACLVVPSFQRTPSLFQLGFHLLPPFIFCFFHATLSNLRFKAVVIP